MSSHALAISAALVALLFAAGARAQDEPLPDVSAPCAPSVTSRRAVLEHDGEPGIWFQLDVARCMLGRLSALPLYAQRVTLLQGRLTLDDERSALVDREVSLAEEGEQQAVDALDAAIRARQRAEDARDAWYRSPALWFALGVVAAVAVGFGVGYALHAAGM